MTHSHSHYYQINMKSFLKSHLKRF